MQGEKAAFRPCAYAEGALAHHGQTLVPRADRRHLRLEGGGRCTVEPADYSIARSIAAALDLPGSGPEGKMRRHLRRKGKRIRRKRPETRGKIRISHSVKERPKQADERSRLIEWADDTLVAAGPVCLLVLADRAVRLLAARRCHHDSRSVSKAAFGLLQGHVPLRRSLPDRGKQFAGHADVTDAL
jgi:IS30 family transposase